VNPYLNSGGFISSVTRVAQRDLTYLHSLSPGLDAMAELSQGWTNHQYAASLAGGYALALNEQLFAAWQSGTGAYPSQGISLFP